MGHGDEICLADGNFPARSVSKRGNAEYIRADGHGVKPILEAVLSLMPLDTFVAQPVKLMGKPEGDKTPTPIWDDYREIISKFTPKEVNSIQFIERFAFYEHASRCYAIVATSEQALYANIILKKGVIKTSSNTP